MNKRETIVKNIKLGVGLLISIGTGIVVNQACKKLTPEDANLVKKISVGVAAAAIGGAVAKMSNDYASEAIDDVDAAINEIQKLTKEDNEEKA